MFGDCSDSTEDMTVDSRDSKDFNPNDDIMDDHNSNISSSHSSNSEEHSSSNINASPAAVAAANHQAAATTKETDSSEERQTMASAQKSGKLNLHRREEDQDYEDDCCDQQPSKKKLKTDMSDDLCSNKSTEENSRDSSKSCNQEEQRSRSARPRSLSPVKCDENSVTNLSDNNTTSPTAVIPKLRLNTLLASDPALMPDAKDLKVLHEETKQTQHRNRVLLQQQQQQQLQQTKEDQEALVNLATGPTNLVEPLLKTQSNVETTAPPPQRMKVFMCLPCGIGFSSPSTLEAHQSYYCSHRNKEADEDNSLSEKTSTTSPHTPAAAAGTNSAAAALSGNAEPLAKAHKTGKQYACTMCSYSADKKVSLNRHMRMHQTSPAAPANSAASNNGSIAAAAAAGVAGVGLMEDNSSQQVDRYCSDCDIRFNNIKTYRAHKQHYCSSRRTEGQLTPKLEVSTTSTTPKCAAVPGAMSPQTRTKTPTPAMVAAAAAAAAVALQQPPATTPFLALPTNPILIIPYSLIRSASLIAGPLASPTSGAINPDTTCFTLDSGNLKPLATALNINALNAVTSSAIANNLSASSAMANQIQQSANESLLTEKNIKRNVEDSTESGTPKRKAEGLRESTPLDLSLRRSPIAALLQRQRFSSASSFLDVEHQHRFDMETLLEAGKENLVLDDSGSITPEQIVCAPSLPNSPSMSPSPRRRAISPRSSGAGSTSSMSPPASLPPASLNAVSSPGSLFDNLQLRQMLPAELLNPLLAKQNLELALKLTAAAAAAASNSASGVSTGAATPAELAAAAVAAATGRGSMLGMPVLPQVAAPAASAPTSSANTPSPANQPQIYVKQGVSKCKECNIVFCKYENYLAHKQHYCSARNQEPAEGDAKISSTPPMASGASTAETTPVAYQQLICAACGIKYTSLDNLRAHQNYYCPKGGGAAAAAAAAAAAVASNAEAVTPQMPLPKEKCTKCKSLHEIGLPCPPPPAQQQQSPKISTPQPTPTTTPTQQQQQQQSSNTTTSTSSSHQNVYKCPLCDAVSLTATESRKHMETHGTVKAFRCTICRYKGNTLRGMRTHIRMHFDKKTSDINEEHYMACILDDEGMEIPSAASLNQEQLVQHLQKQHQLQAAAAAVAANLQQQQQQLQQQQQQINLQQQQQQQQVFNCDICNYTSTYKGNVLRHMKLLHPHVAINSPSISPEAGDMESMETGSMSSSHNGENNFTIKSEPLDHMPPTSTTPGLMLNPHDNNNSPIPAAQHQQSVATNDMVMTHIKSEPMEIPIEPSAIRSPAAIGPPPPLNSTPEDNIHQKYCQTCDISFNYMKTYLAHKQFYCKNKIRRPDSASDSPSPNSINAAIASPNSIIMQKNKENLQQEAGI